MQVRNCTSERVSRETARKPAWDGRAPRLRVVRPGLIARVVGPTRLSRASTALWPTRSNERSILHQPAADAFAMPCAGRCWDGWTEVPMDDVVADDGCPAF